MRTPLRRYYGSHDLHFITFSCYRRRPYLGTPRARDHFAKALDQARNRWKFPLIGYVIMPEHVHLLMGEPPKGDPSKVLQVLKQTVSRAMSNHEADHLWQRRFYDFNVRSAKKQKEKLEYMHANPVKRRLVAHPKDWPWSSWSFYEKGEDGLIAIDIAGEKRSEDNTTERKSQNPHP